MEGDEDRVFANRTRPLQGEHPRRPPRRQRDPLAIGHTVKLGGCWVHFCERLGRHLFELLDVAGLRARLVMRQDAAGCQEEWIFAVAVVDGRLMRNAMETRAAVWRGKPADEQARGARMVAVRTRPEHPVLRVDTLVGDAGVIGRCAAGGATELREDIAARREREVCTLVEGRGQRGDDLEVGAYARRRVERATAQDDAPLEVRHRALFLRPLRRGKDDVGERGGFR